MDSQIKIKAPILEVNFINDIVLEIALQYSYLDPETGETKYASDSTKKYEINSELKQRFLDEYLGSEWHTDKDMLEYIIFYNTGEYFCQRRKLKYDFNTESSYWVSYEYKGATEEQVADVFKKITDLTQIQEIVKETDLITKIEKIDKEYLFYDQRYNKRILEKNKMLAASDWRVLPDVVDTYPGEKDMWIKWRSEMRNLLIIHPSEFENSLELLKHLYNLRWPIDPKIYKEKYPNDEVEYLSTDDQWVERDVEASTDFVEQRLRNVLELRQRYVDSRQVVKKELLDLMKMLRVEDITEKGLDYTKFYTTEELNDLQV